MSVSADCRSCRGASGHHRGAGAAMEQSVDKQRILVTVQYSTVQYSTVQYGTVQYSTVQYSTVPAVARGQPRHLPEVVRAELDHSGGKVLFLDFI